MSDPEDEPSKPPPSEPPAPDGGLDDRTIFAEESSAPPVTAAELVDEGADRTMIADEATGAALIAAAGAHHSIPPPDATVISSAPTVEPTVHKLEPGTLINNNYRILALISTGGMGEVYRAENVFTGDPVAVKVILAELAMDEAILDLFRREARVLVQLRDEAIVRYHNFVLDGGSGRYCLIMEFVEGRHLGTRLKEDGGLPDDAALQLTRRLANGLRRAHSRGVTHRDLSPDNVILRDDKLDEPVLIDFGIARSTEFGDGLAGRFAGKFKYVAPEQLGHFGGEIGPQTDVYGLGLLIATTARGKALPMGDSVVSASAARQQIPDLTGISYRLFPLLQHMLEPDPARRPADMGAVGRMVRDPTLIPAQYRLPLWPITSDAEVAPVDEPTHSLKTDSDSPFSIVTPSDSAAIARPVAEPEKNRTPLIAALLAGALLVAGGAGWWMMSGKPDAPETPVIAPVAADMAPRDEATREGFLAAEPLPPCTYVERIADGPNAGMISVLSEDAFDPTAILDAYAAKFNVHPTVVQGHGTEAQCAVIDFLREIAGRAPTPPALTAQLSQSEGGLALVGKVGAPETRNLWLFLAAPDGAIYDLTAQAPAKGNSRDFGVNIAATGDMAASTPLLLVALTTDAALSSVAAAPAGANAATLLPRILADLRRNKESPAASTILLDAPKSEAEPGSVPPAPEDN